MVRGALATREFAIKLNCDARPQNAARVLARVGVCERRPHEAAAAFPHRHWGGEEEGEDGEGGRAGREGAAWVLTRREVGTARVASARPQDSAAASSAVCTQPRVTPTCPRAARLSGAPSGRPPPVAPPPPQQQQQQRGVGPHLPDVEPPEQLCVGAKGGSGGAGWEAGRSGCPRGSRAARRRWRGRRPVLRAEAAFTPRGAKGKLRSVASFSQGGSVKKLGGGGA